MRKKVYLKLCIGAVLLMLNACNRDVSTSSAVTAENGTKVVAAESSANVNTDAEGEKGRSDNTTAEETFEEIPEASRLASDIADEEFSRCECVFLQKITMNYEDVSFYIPSPKPERVDIYSYVITFDDSYSLYRSLNSLQNLKPRYKNGAINTASKIYWLYDDDTQTTGFEFGYFVVPEGTALEECELYLNNNNEAEAIKALPTDFGVFDFSEYADRLVQFGGHYFVAENIGVSDGVGGDDVYYIKSMSETINYICLDDLTFELNPERFRVDFDTEISDVDSDMITINVQKNNNINSFNVQQFEIGFSLKSDAARYGADEEYKTERSSLCRTLLDAMNISYQE